MIVGNLDVWLIVFIHYLVKFDARAVIFLLATFVGCLHEVTASFLCIRIFIIRIRFQVTCLESLMEILYIISCGFIEIVLKIPLTRPPRGNLTIALKTDISIKAVADSIGIPEHSGLHDHVHETSITIALIQDYDVV